MSYLDDPRVFFACERTLLAWQRTAVALIGLGFVVERFGLFVRFVTGGAALPAGSLHMSLLFGVFFLLTAALIAVVSAWQYRAFIRELSYPEIPRGHLTWPGPMMNFLLALASLGMAGWFVIAE